MAQPLILVRLRCIHEKAKLTVDVFYSWWTTAANPHRPWCTYDCRSISLQPVACARFVKSLARYTLERHASHGLADAHTTRIDAFTSQPVELCCLLIGRSASNGCLDKGQYLTRCFRYRSLSDRLLGMSLVPTSSQVKREVSYEFMNRQMVWHAFTVCSYPFRIQSCPKFRPGISSVLIAPHKHEIGSASSQAADIATNIASDAFEQFSRHASKFPAEAR